MRATTMYAIKYRNKYALILFTSINSLLAYEFDSIYLQSVSSNLYNSLLKFDTITVTLCWCVVLSLLYCCYFVKIINNHCVFSIII